MKDKKQLLLVAALGLISSMSVAFLATHNNNTSMFISKAGAGKINKTLVLNNTTPLEVTGTAGDLVIGNIGARASYCEAFPSGVATMTAGKFALYCAGEGLDASSNYYGFSSSDITSFTIVLNNRNVAFNLSLRWARVTSSLSISAYTSGTSLDVAASSENQTIEFTTENSIIDSKVSGYPCICFYSDKTGKALDIISVTVEYGCTPRS